MNVRHFIAEIEKRRTLWDQQDKNYHNKRILAHLWLEVANIFNTEGNDFLVVTQETSTLELLN